MSTCGCREQFRQGADPNCPVHGLSDVAEAARRDRTLEHAIKAKEYREDQMLAIQQITEGSFVDARATLDRLIARWKVKP